MLNFDLILCEINYFKLLSFLFFDINTLSFSDSAYYLLPVLLNGLIKRNFNTLPNIQIEFRSKISINTLHTYVNCQSVDGSKNSISSQMKQQSE